jgi:hypothetical protein
MIWFNSISIQLVQDFKLTPNAIKFSQTQKLYHRRHKNMPSEQCFGNYIQNYFIDKRLIVNCDKMINSISC